MKIVLLLTILSLAVSDVDPPIYDQPFRISFDETIVQNKTKYHVNGKMFYDPINQKSRVDRANGRYNPFCGTILSDQTTPCQQFFTNDKLWITFPAKQVCCFCCDASHGCRMSTPDALKNAVYVGRERLDQDDVLMDKWALDSKLCFKIRSTDSIFLGYCWLQSNSQKNRSCQPYTNRRLWRSFIWKPNNSLPRWHICPSQLLQRAKFQQLPS